MNWTLKKRIGVALTAAVVVVIVLVTLSGRQPVARVAAVQALRENLSASITTNGKVEPIAPHGLRAQFPAFVEKVLVAEGQAVKRGQLLLALHANETRAALARAREQLASAQDDVRAARAGGRADERAALESDLRKAELELNRLRREREALEHLVPKQAATKDELDRNQTALERAQADVQQLRKKTEEFARRTSLDLERAGLRVESLRNEVRALEQKVRSAQLTAPVDGTLYSLPVRSGDFVRLGDLLAEVADLRRVRVRAFIDEPDLGSLEPAQQVEITWEALAGRVWYGRIEQVPKQVLSRGTRSVGEVLCSVPNDAVELLPNVNVNARIHLRERASVLVVPRGAVRTEGSRRFVFVVADGGLGNSRLQKREIKVGIANATNYEVLEGLNEGERVALPGDAELQDGLRVQVVQTG